MSNTVFKLRRSSVAGKVPNTSTLTIGELGLNLTDQKLFSSDGSSVFELGANVTTQYVYSTLSVGNSSVNTVINSSSISVNSIIANGSVGTANQVLTSNGTSTYWSDPTGGSTIGGSNTQIQFNDSGVANGSANFTFNKSTNTITIGSSSNTFNTYFGNSTFHGYAKTDFQNKFVDFGVESSNSSGYFSSYFYLNGTNPQMWAYAGPSDGSQMYIDFYVVGANQTIGSATLESVYYKQFGAYEKNILNRFISNSTTSYYESSYSNTADGIYNSVITVTNSSVSSITLGNSTVNATINSTAFSGTSNNTSFVGSVSAANVVSNAQLSANLSNYQTTAGLSANVATLTSNNSTYFAGQSQSYYANVTSPLITTTVTVGNSTVNATINSTAFSGTSNNTSFVGSVSAANVVSNAQLSANLSNYQTTSGLASNVATLTANNTSFVGSVSAANVVSNAQLSANLSNYQTTAELSANVATLTANNTSFVGTVSAANVVSNAQLSANLSNYQTTAGLSANVATLTANAATYATSSATNTFTIGTAAYHVSNGNFGIGTSSPAAKLQIGGNSLQYSNLVGIRTPGNQYEFGHSNINGYGSVIGAEVGSGSPFIAFNSGTGTNNNTYKTYGIKGVVIRTDNAGSLLFNTVDIAANTDNQTPTERMRIDSSGNVGIGNTAPIDKLSVNGTTFFQGNVTLGNSTITVGLQANGTYGTAGQILTSNGTATYWSTISAGVSGSNTQIQFNDSGAANGSAGFTFTKTSNTISVGNSTVNTVANGASILPGILALNNQTINDNFTIPASTSTVMAGPVTVATGKTLTVTSGSRLVVV